MPNQTFEPQSAVQVGLPAPAARLFPRRTRAILVSAGAPWSLVAGALLVLSLLVIVWARTRPGYDPYGWLVWGKLAVHLKLDTNGAPSWKPLPFLFTVPYALFGHYALWLWMVTSVAISLSGPVFAWRIAFRLTAAEPERRYAAYIAGLSAALFVLAMRDSVGHLTYIHYVLSAESDTMIVALCLAAVDCHLGARHRWAFWIWWLAALGRPEVWPFAAVAAAWLWRADTPFRPWLIGGVLMALFFWFGIPALSSKSAFTAGNIAQNSPRAVRGNKVIGTLSRFHAVEANTVWAAAAVTTALALLRRNLIVIALAAGALVWLVIEVVFSVRGFPSVPRYMFEAAAVVATLAGLLIGWLVLALPPLLAAAVQRLAPFRIRPALARRIGGWGSGLALLAIAGSAFGFAHSDYRLERADLIHERNRTVLIAHLSTVVRRLGASSILACGTPHIPIAYQSILAWYLDVKIGALYVSEKHELAHPRPLVNIYPARGLGWKVFPSHEPQASASRCSKLQLIIR